MARILVIDSEPAYCDSLELVLSRAGHEVRIARSSRQGIREGISYRPDLAIVDWTLAGEFSGGEVAEQIHATHPQVRAIVISGYSDTVKWVKDSYPFVDEVIHKPFHRTEILKAVERVLARAAASSPQQQDPM